MLQENSAELPLPATARRSDGMAGKWRAQALPTARDLEGIRVLLVEDNPVNQLVARAVLEEYGAIVTVAGDGRLAIQSVVAQSIPFDVVLMDIQMPEMDGYEATVELRKRFGPDRLPIIAMTAAALVEERQRCEAVGMNDFIAKPFEPEPLRATLLRWTRLKSTSNP